jgi:PhnB protein
MPTLAVGMGGRAIFDASCPRQAWACHRNSWACHPNGGKVEIMQIQPYLFFNGRCEEAIDFYRTAVGAEATMLMRYKDSPEPTSHGAPEKVMHASLRIGDTTVLVSDGQCSGQLNFQGFALTLIASNDAEAQRRFAALGDGGHVQMPLSKTFFSSKFGMVADRFGVLWMIYVAP